MRPCIEAAERLHDAEVARHLTPAELVERQQDSLIELSLTASVEAYWMGVNERKREEGRR